MTNDRSRLMTEIIRLRKQKGITARYYPSLMSTKTMQQYLAILRETYYRKNPMNVLQVSMGVKRPITVKVRKDSEKLRKLYNKYVLGKNNPLLFYRGVPEVCVIASPTSELAGKHFHLVLAPTEIEQLKRLGHKVSLDKCLAKGKIPITRKNPIPFLEGLVGGLGVGTGFALAKKILKNPLPKTKKCPKCGKRLELHQYGYSHFYTLAQMMGNRKICTYSERIK